MIKNLLDLVFFIAGMGGCLYLGIMIGLYLDKDK